MRLRSHNSAYSLDTYTDTGWLYVLYFFFDFFVFWYFLVWVFFKFIWSFHRDYVILQRRFFWYLICWDFKWVIFKLEWRLIVFLWVVRWVDGFNWWHFYNFKRVDNMRRVVDCTRIKSCCWDYVRWWGNEWSS